MSGMQVVVIDDSEDRVKSMVKRIEGVPLNALDEPIVGLSGEELSTAIKFLLERKASFGKSGWQPGSYGHHFDRADVLVIDYDLSGLYGQDALMTGEDVAKLARLYTRAGVIVSVNRFGAPEFDFRLRPRSASWADYSIAHEDLGISGLWVGEDWSDEYRPWYWPVLASEPELYKRRIEFAYRHREKSVADLLDIPQMALKLMPSELYDQLFDLEDVTIIALAREHILSPKTPRLPDRQVVRVVVAEISKWLASQVLPRQDILIDAPHLVTLFPSLLTAKATRKSLNATCKIGEEVSVPLDDRIVGKDRLKNAFWLNRPVWWTEEVMENETIEENQTPWKKEDLPLVFAEDSSRFEELDKCTEFRTDGLFRRRYVRRSAEMMDHARYRPESRLIE